MRRHAILLAITFSIGIFHHAAFSQDSVEPFTLQGVGGNTVSLESSADRFSVVAFLGNECPLAKLYASRLNSLSQEFSGAVRILGINSNRQDSVEEIDAFCRSLNIGFEIAKDHRNLIADQFGAKRTPEVFLLDGDLRILYRGRIDDQYQPGVAKPAPTRHDLKVAITEALAGDTITVPVTEVEGCIIGRVKIVDSKSNVTFSNQISRVLKRNCVECHRAGDIGPFSLTDYEEVVGWADMIVEVVDEGRMPPWHADPKHGEFTNARLMPEADKQLLREWVESGAPFGKPAELPVFEKRIEGWNLPRQPDVVFQMRDKEFMVPADGTVPYQYFVVDPEFEEDKWVVGAEIVPGNRSVVHHSIVLCGLQTVFRFGAWGG